MTATLSTAALDFAAGQAQELALRIKRLVDFLESGLCADADVAAVEALIAGLKAELEEVGGRMAALAAGA